MARKGKDLFVILAERQQRHEKSKGKDGKGVESTVREVGETLGKWVKGAVASMRDSESSDGKAKAKDGAKRARARPRSNNRSPQQVPRGLLVPGWLLVGMIVASLGGGFLIGRVTSGLGSRLGLSGGPAVPGPLTPDMTQEEEERELGPNFYVCGAFDFDATSGRERARKRAADLARQLRHAGQSRTRISHFAGKEGSPSWWTTLCYPAPGEDPAVVLRALQDLEGRLRFQVDPELKIPVLK